eukprot:7383529-Prymnesium_polylepis.1
MSSRSARIFSASVSINSSRAWLKQPCLPIASTTVSGVPFVVGIMGASSGPSREVTMKKRVRTCATPYSDARRGYLLTQ